MNAFITAMTQEITQARTDLSIARSLDDDAAVADALDRLSDLRDLFQRASESVSPLVA